MRRSAALLSACLVTGFAAALTAAQPSPQDLKRLSIEELMQINVTIAARC